MSLPEIVLKLKPLLKQLPEVHAMWIEGSYANGSFSSHSDIDLWLDVNRDAFENVCRKIAEQLQSIEVLRASEELSYYSQDPDLAKAKFFVAGKSDEQRIELDLQAHGRDFIFNRDEHDIVVLFDKKSVIRWNREAGQS